MTVGGTDRDALLRALGPERRPGVWTVCTLPGEPPAALVAAAGALVREAEGTTLVLPVATAAAAGLPEGGRWAWITLTVASSLEAVGLMAAVAAALAARGIPANPLAGHHHDHLLVPADRADDALAALHALSAAARR